MDENKRIIEINGVKLEVDLSTARRIDEFKVGDNVKVLRKTYGDSYEVIPGVITDFVSFKALPTIVIAVYKEAGYSTPPSIDFIYYNAKTEGTEIAAACEHELKLSRDTVSERFEAAIKKKQQEANELRAHLDFFKEKFGRYFREGI